VPFAIAVVVTRLDVAHIPTPEIVGTRAALRRFSVTRRWDIDSAGDTNDIRRAPASRPPAISAVSG